MPRFVYERAFARNIGWVTAAEQAILRERRVAIAGLGGVGGSHLLGLTRLGIGKFHLADFDAFDLENFNRQAGATTATLGRAKVEVLRDMAIEVNPELELRLFDHGVTTENLDAFLAGVDVYVDGLDFFALDARRATFAACARRAIPAITVAPLGMSAALLNFLPGGMTFEDYFGLEGRDAMDQAIRFLIGLAPRMLHRTYLIEPNAVDLVNRRGPSTIIACQLCSGIAAAEALKILLGRGCVRGAPHGLQFDAYRNRLVNTWRPGGNRNPLQRLAIAIARQQLSRMGSK